MPDEGGGGEREGREKCAGKGGGRKKVVSVKVWMRVERSGINGQLSESELYGQDST